MLTLPPQRPAIIRNLTAGLVPDGDPSREGVGALCSSQGVRASASRCAGLTGPAQSLCYAALYGVYV